jgi:hypothetical protein
MDPTESCARCGGDVSHGATYAPDSSLLCSSCTSALKTEASAIRAEQARQAASRKAKGRWTLGLASVGTLALTIFGYSALWMYFSSLKGCGFHPLDFLLALLDAAGKSY